MSKFFINIVLLVAFAVVQGCTTLAPNKALDASGALNAETRAQIIKLVHDDETDVVVIGITNKGGATSLEVQQLKQAIISFYNTIPEAKGKRLDIEFRPDLTVASTAELFQGTIRNTGRPGMNYRNGKYVVVGAQQGYGNRNGEVAAGAGAYAGHTETHSAYQTPEGMKRVTVTEYHFGAGAGVEGRGSFRANGNDGKRYSSDEKEKRESDKRNK